MTVKRCNGCKRPFPPTHIGRSVTGGRWYCTPACFFDDKTDSVWSSEVSSCTCTTCTTKRKENR